MGSGELNRREFIGAVAAGCAAGTAMASPRGTHLRYVGQDSEVPVERLVQTVCGQCPGGCGLTVRVMFGEAVGIAGNDWHPVNRGGVCPRGPASLQAAYNPDRVRGPLAQRGAKPASSPGAYQSVGWDEATATLAARLRNLRDAGHPERLAVLFGHDRGLVRRAWQRFCQAFGTPNFIEYDASANLGPFPAVRATHGIRHRIGYDLEQANFVFSFGSCWLDNHWSCAQASRVYGSFRRSRSGFRPRLVHAEPRRSFTAAKADEWIPINPGTEGALAMACAHVILREGLFDREFVELRTHGFDDWTDEQGRPHVGFRTIALRHYSPEAVGAVCGVPEGTIFRVAREFASNRPAIAVGYDGQDCSAQRTYDRAAVHALNALVGSIDVPGGITVFDGLELLAGGLEPDAKAREGLSRPRVGGQPGRTPDPLAAARPLDEGTPDALPEAILSGKPYPIDTLILLDVDPVFHSARGDAFAEALAKVPFVVSVGNWLDESNAYADLLLPVHHALERWGFDVSYTLAGEPVLTLGQPAIAPTVDSLDPYGLVKTLATGVAETVSAALPWPDAESAVRAACREAFDSGRGAPFGPENEEGWARLLERSGWRAPFVKDFDTFFAQMREGGGWIDPSYYHHWWERTFARPKRRFAFHSPLLAETVGRPTRPAGELDEQADLRCMPHYEPPQPGEAAYPLRLYVYKLPALAGMTHTNVPWLRDIAGAQVLTAWDTWVEMSPETASKHGIRDDDPVAVSTARGSLTLRARVTPDLMPGVIAAPFGLGSAVGGRWCRDVGANPARIVRAVPDPLSGVSYWQATWAAVRPA